MPCVVIEVIEIHFRKLIAYSINKDNFVTLLKYGIALNKDFYSFGLMAKNIHLVKKSYLLVLSSFLTTINSNSLSKTFI